jgi:hypothetical protein
VHVDIDEVGRQSQKEKSHRIPATQEQAAVGFLQGVRYDTIPEPTTIEE